TCTFDSVDVAGGKINNWAGGTILRPISAGSSIHTVTVALDSGEVEYKFRKLINGSPSWEGIANRLKSISSDTVLALVCFDKDTLCTPLPAAADVTFVVDLSNEIPDPNGDVYVMGNFTEPNWQGGAIKMTPVVGQIGMYQATFNMCPGTFAFKFTNGLPSATNTEETFPNAADRGCVVNNGVGGFNRTYERTNGNPVSVGFVFNTCTTAVVTGIEKNQLAASSVSLFPNPTEENATVKFNDNSNISNVIVTDLAGRIIAEYKNVSDKNLNINTASFEAGIYFVSVMNENNETATVKLMVR
ncbi:MAG: T9SS type A sorting domain-containing protein, partial [bacterium]